MAATIVNCEEVAIADVVLLSANYDRTSSFGKGADKGPERILYCLNTQIEIYDRVSGWSPAERLAIAHLDLGDLNALAPAEMVAHVRGAYGELAGKFALLLGGEHSVTNGPVEALREESSGITVVQIDAHADLRFDDSDYNECPHGKYAHCAVMRRVIEAGYHLVQVGVRAYSAEERDLFFSPRVKVFEWDGKETSPFEIVRVIPTERVYLSIDVDGLDPSVIPGTGTPVPGGLSWYYLMDLLKALASERKIIGADIVELAPREHESLSEYTAAQIAYSIMGLRFKQ